MVFNLCIKLILPYRDYSQFSFVNFIFLEVLMEKIIELRSCDFKLQSWLGFIQNCKQMQLMWSQLQLQRP